MDAPPVGRLKLNVDGAFKIAAGDAGGGGILRDHHGRCVFAFATKYQGVITALDAEARALRDDLAICCNQGILDIMVETDSLNLMRIVTGKMSWPWELTCVIQDIAVTTQTLKAQIKHVPREANQVANALAGYGCSTNNFSFWGSGAVLPHVVKGPYRLDKVAELRTTTDQESHWREQADMAAASTSQWRLQAETAAAEAAWLRTQMEAAVSQVGELTLRMQGSPADQAELV
ncbi:hypothetical protein Taro_046207 [Colocasia esculenta]|uniref:RNase H type-1 domain-containing protein n=1 Tax=Colocasia esculenta TaxID=4460 RepID=A0A843X771_COLES|nr:hypothetical protein [Colocasia esculenta]